MITLLLAALTSVSFISCHESDVCERRKKLYFIELKGKVKDKYDKIDSGRANSYLSISNNYSLVEIDFLKSTNVYDAVLIGDFIYKICYSLIMNVYRKDSLVNDFFSLGVNCQYTEGSKIWEKINKKLFRNYVQV